jgi:hypothetical protein
MRLLSTIDRCNRFSLEVRTAVDKRCEGSEVDWLGLKSGQIPFPVPFPWGRRVVVL